MAATSAKRASRYPTPSDCLIVFAWQAERAAKTIADVKIDFICCIDLDTVPFLFLMFQVFGLAYEVMFEISLPNFCFLETSARLEQNHRVSDVLSPDGQRSQIFRKKRLYPVCLDPHFPTGWIGCLGNT